MEKFLCVTTAAAKDITPKIAAHRRAKANLKARAKASAKASVAHMPDVWAK